MGWTTEQKQQTREKILNSAAELFTRDGFDQVGINEVMQHANLTRGAFYNHFSSKSELYAEAIMTAALTARARAAEAGDNLFAQMVEQYMSLDHRSGDEIRCPLAFLTTDITQRDDQVRNTYTRVLKGFIKNLQQVSGSSVKNETEAMQKAILMIGAVAVSRAINDDDYAVDLLESCKAAVIE